MEQKISKLAKVVATAARMEKKAEYYDAIATFINPDGNYFEKRKFMGEYTEDEIIKEVIREFPKVKKEDIDIEFGVQSSKKSNLNKKVAKLHKKAATMTKEEILEDIFQNNIEFDDESKEARLTDDKGRLVEIFELSEKEEDLRKQFDKYVEENDLLDDKYYYFEKNEQAKEEDAYLDSYDYLYSLLVNGNISFYRERLENMTGKEIVQYINWADEMGIDKAKLRLDLLK